MSNRLSKLVHKYEGDTCAKFDEILAQKAKDSEKPDPVVALAKAWNAGKIAITDIEEGELRKAVKAAALTI